MRKLYILAFTISVLSAYTSRVIAQTANTYSFSASAGATLDPMTGATTIITSGLDDATSFVQDIGFTFRYEDVPFTQFSASADGFLKLGSTAAASQFTNSITSTTNIPKLFPFWDDLSTGSNGSVKFLLTGIAPNRILIVQWFVPIPRSTTGPANSTMQVWLYETSNKIEFRYGAGVGPATSASIGINGAIPTNYISVTSPANTSSTTTANNSNTVWPGNGTMYTFLPPPQCTGSPTGGTTSGPSGTCVLTTFTLTVTGATAGVGALSYQWESSPDNTTWTPIPGATAKDLTTSVAAVGNTYFRRKITCTPTAEFAHSTSLLVSTLPAASLPLSEGFNTSGTSIFPGCWTQQYVVGTNNLSFQTSSSSPPTTPYEGTRYVFWNSFSFSSGSETRLVSPPITTASIASLEVQFYWYNENSTSYNSGDYFLEGVQVQYSLDKITWTNAGSFIPRYDPTLPAGTRQWKLKSINLPAGAANQPFIFVGFKFHSSFGNNCSLDAVKIQTPCATITSQPQPATQNVCVGSSAMFTIAASGTGLSYQWRKGGVNLINGGNISGADSDTLRINNVTLADADNYDVVITGTCATVVTSSAVSLGVYPPPTINTQPQNQSVCPGDNATFTIATTGAGITYQWRKGGVNLVNGGNISGVTTNTLTLTGATATDAGTYDVIVTQNCSLASSPAVLNLFASPSITTQPTNQSACLGGNATFSVVAAGTGLTYQWRKAGVDLVNGGSISGATSNTLTITGVVAGDAGTYDVVVSGTCTPPVTSNGVTLTPQTAIAITTQPVNRTGCQNGTVTFTGAATGTITTTQWEVSTNGGSTWSSVTGATTQTLTLTSVQPSQSGYRYRLALSSAGCGTVYSNVVTLTVNPLPTVTLVLNPASQTALKPGMKTTVTVSSSPAGASYQWLVNGVGQPQITGSSYVVDAFHLGSYTVKVTDVNGCVNTSAAVTFTGVPTSQMYVYPNPTSGSFSVTYYTRTSMPVTINIIDMKGKRIVQRQESTSDPYTRFDFTNDKLAAGVYVIEFRDPDENLLAAGRLVVTR